MIVDSYAHVSLRKYQPVERLIEQMELAEVEHAVLVQPLGDYDNSYLRTILQQYPKLFTAVGLIEVNTQNSQAQLKRLIQIDGFAGIRATAEVLISKNFISTLEAINGVLVLHLPQGIGPFLDQIIAIAESYAGLRIFLPHLGWPRVDGQPTSKWEQAIELLSKYPNVTVGISALYHFSISSFPHEDTWSLIEFLVKNIGPERCMCGSDFPLLLETESYSEFFSIFNQGGLQGLPEVRNIILGSAAVRFWSIS